MQTTLTVSVVAPAVIVEEIESEQGKEALKRNQCQGHLQLFLPPRLTLFPCTRPIHRSSPTNSIQSPPDPVLTSLERS